MKLIYMNWLFLLLMATHTLEATTYYVSSSGNDNNDGSSEAQAWATISKVNITKFLPGDIILFEGESTFTGGIFFSNTITGTADHPIVISSFGRGRATIDSGDSYGLMLYNTAGFNIKNIIFKGTGTITNSASGITFYMDMPNSRLNHILIDSVEVYGYRDSGISIGSWNGTSGFDDVSITHSVVHDNGDAGILTYAEAVLGHRNFYLGYNKVFNNSGLPEKTYNHSGNGIVLGGIDGAVIEYCEAYNNGWLNAFKNGGPVGIWGWSCNNLVIQYNESHHNKTGTSKDGGGFDIDGGCTNCTLQYNYSHDNDGPGYLIAQYSNAPPMNNVVIRYNISENDARKNSAGAIHLWSSGSNGGIQHAEIYNNTIYLTPSDSGSPKAITIEGSGISNSRISNNIFQTTGGLKLVQVSIDNMEDLRFEGNDYWPTGNNFIISWVGATYSSLDAWREATGQEMLLDEPVGLMIDPELADPGNGVIISDPTKLYTLTGYILNESSELIGKGINLADEFDINMGKIDFWGNSVEQREDLCVGAHQVTDHTKVCLYGGTIGLTFGQIIGGVYTGKGVVEEKYFSPEIAGIGNHAILCTFIDEEGHVRSINHTITVVDATSTEWIGQNTLSDNWFDSHNWSTCIPTPMIDAVVSVPLQEVEQEESYSLPIIKSGQYAQVKNISVKNHFIVEGGGTLEINGNFEIEKLEADYDSNIIFSNDNDQTIPGGTYGKLVLSGNGNKILSGDVVVSSELDMQSSNLQLGDHILTIGNAGTIQNYSSSSYIVTDGSGKLVYEAVGGDRFGIFPVGTMNSYTPAMIQNEGEIDDFSVWVVEGVLLKGVEGAKILQGVVDKTWHVEEKIKGGSNVALNLQWNASDELVNFFRPESFISHYENEEWSLANGNAGEPITGSEDDSYIKSLDNVTSFSPFTVDSDGIPLPITLRSFNVTTQGTDVILNWETANEVNNQGFNIEVSEDAKNFRYLGFVASEVTNSTQTQHYSFRDSEMGKTGTRYYRLGQVDLNGTISYSKIKLISFPWGDVSVTAYPNPFSDKITLEVTTTKEEEMKLTMRDALGQILFTKETFLKEGTHRWSFSSDEKHPSGLYLLTVQIGNTVHRLKIMQL